MITPEYLQEVMNGTETALAGVTRRIIKRLCQKIVDTFTKGDEVLMPSTMHELRRLTNNGLTMQEIEKMVTDELPNMQKEVRKAFEHSAGEIAKYNDDFTRQIIDKEKIDVKEAFFESVGMPKQATKYNMTPRELDRLESAYRRTNGEVKNLTGTTANSAQQAFIQACDNAFMEVQAGASPDQAILNAIEEVARNGVRTVYYDTGHTDRIEVAIARAVRTGINQANTDVILMRCAEMGVDAVKVSEHYGARVTKMNDYTNHSWWQGKVYHIDWKKMPAEYSQYYKQPTWLEQIKRKISGKSKKHPDLIECCGYGKIQGICGINCRHTITGFYDGVNIDRGQQIDPKENEKRYRLEQKQRAMEREIRNTKNEIEALKDCGLQDNVTEQALRDANKRLRQQGEAYGDFCRDNNLPYRNIREL